MKKILRSKRAEILIVILLFVFSLRVINWFEYPYIVVSGDLRPPLVQEAFNKRVIYTWDETDFGMPSVYQSRILIPSYFFISVFQNLGMDLFWSQLIAIFLMYSIASALMYIYVKQLTNGDIIAAFVAAVFLTSNIYLISDREQTAIGFIDTTLMILPSIVTFTEGVKRKSYVLLALSGILFTLTYGTFPNYRVMFLDFLTALLTLLFLYLNEGLGVRYEKKKTGFIHASLNVDLMFKYLKYLAVFIVAIFLASIWIVATVSASFGSFLATYEHTVAPTSLLKYIQFHDVLRLISKWSFYASAFGTPYVPYADTFLHNPLLIALSFSVPILAFASVLNGNSRKLTLFFSGILLVALLLAGSGVSDFYYTVASNVPLMIVFRESAQWLFFAIISCGVLIGIVASALHHKFKKNILKIVTVGLVVMVLFSSSYPLVTGSVTVNWLDTNIKGSFFPNSYAQLNHVLSNEYWALLLPQKYTYIVYNFTEGPLSLGNPYPLVFSKPIISGLGTEYLRSDNMDLLNKIYGLMLTGGYENVAMEGNASASSVEQGEFSPAQAIDGNYNTRWASNLDLPQWFEIEWNEAKELSKLRIVFESAYANDYTVETWDGFNWITQIKVENNTSIEPEYLLSQSIPTTRLRIDFTRASPFNMVSIWELEVYTQSKKGLSKFLGMLGIEYLILEKDIVSGNFYNVSELGLDQNQNFILAKEWDEISLYNNTYALQRFYVADNSLNYTTLDNLFQTVDESKWETLQHSVLLNSTSTGSIQEAALAQPQAFAWSTLSPTSYLAHVESKGAFLLAFLESYDEHWRVSVNGSPVPETNHHEVNAFANGWLINQTGDLMISVQYETQNVFLISVIASLILPAFFLAFLSRKELKRITALVSRRIQSLKAKAIRKM